MRTITLLTFSELSEEAKNNAIESFRNKHTDWLYDSSFDEIKDSVNKLCVLFNFETVRKYSELKCDSEFGDLCGLRLRKYILNNFGDKLFKPTYLKTFDGVLKTNAFKTKIKRYSNGKVTTTIYSKLKVDTSCVLTGVCYDDDILQPIYDFIAKPTEINGYELLSLVENAISKCFENEEDYQQSDEAYSEFLEINDIYEFDEDGEYIC